MDDTTTRHAELRADLAEIRQEILASELRLAALLGDKLAALSKEFRQELHVVDNKIERRFSDLILWSFVFWVGAVGAIALLARALRP